MQNLVFHEEPEFETETPENKTLEKKSKKTKKGGLNQKLPFFNENKNSNDLNAWYPLKSVSEDGLITTKIAGNTEYSYLYACQGYDLASLSENEYQGVLESYWSFFKNFGKSFKEIYTAFPEDNEENLSYLEKKLEHSDSNQQALLLEEIRKDKVLAKDYRSNQSFITVYGSNLRDLEENVQTLMSSGNSLFNFVRLDQAQVYILFDLLNNGAHRSFTPHPNWSTELNTLKATVPDEISFTKARSIHVNQIKQAIITVSALATDVNYAWILDFIRHPFVVATTIDYSRNPKYDYRHEVSKTLETNIVKFRYGKKMTVQDEASIEVNRLRNLATSINEEGEVIQTLLIRMLVNAESEDELNKRVSEVLQGLDSKGHKAHVYTNMQYFDWSSRFISYDLQYKLSLGREGVERPSVATALGFAHNQTFLHDRTGLFYGSTKTHGSVYFDIFTKTPERLSYNIFITGTMGGGKSTLLKKLTIDNYMKNNYIYGFDKSGEFLTLCKTLGGAYINLDGSNGIINLLQVFPLISVGGEDGESLEVDVEASFSEHLTLTVSRLRMFGNTLDDQAKDAHIRSILRDFYKSRGLDSKDKVRPITDRRNQDYPTFDDLNDYLRNHRFDTDFQETVKELKVLVADICDNQRNKFVGHTSIDGLLNKRMIFFNIKDIKQGETGEFDVLFNVALTLILTLAQKTGRQEKTAYEKGLKDWDDLQRTLIVVDESHNVLNPQKYYATLVFSTQMREARKFLISFALATQLIETMIPSNAGKMGGNEGLAVQNLQEIIGLCQYKAWMKQSDTSIKTLKENFPVYFREQDYEAMQKFKVVKNAGSEMILSGAGNKSLAMYNFATAMELDLFKGGA